MRDRRFWLYWIGANAIGELFGLGGVAAVTAIALQRSGPPSGVRPAVMFGLAFALLGAYEGVVVGMAQWIVLQRRLITLRASAWSGATATGAVVAWMLGLLPGSFFHANASGAEPVPEPPLVLVLLFGILAGAVLGAILGGAQWIVLRRFVRHAGIWPAANAAAWGVAMPLLFVLGGVPNPGSSVVVVVTIIALGLVAAGGSVGAIHGVFLIRLLAGSSGTRDASHATTPMPAQTIG